MRYDQGLPFALLLLACCTNFPDEDGDGFDSNSDCDDNDPDEHPGVVWHTDMDQDGYGDPLKSTDCERGDPTDTTNGEDCNDDDATLNPTTPGYTDADNDGYGDGATPGGSLSENSLCVHNYRDCDDSDATRHPGAAEISGDGVDNDCDWRTPDDDSDGDSYSDEHENRAGTDPTDPTSLVYTGGWPYSPDKESIVDPGWETEAATGIVFPRLQAHDQFGQAVDLYDYAFQGVPVLVDLSTLWCAPCRAIAAWLSSGDKSYVDEYVWWKDAYEPIYDLVAYGDILWITILYEDAEHNDLLTVDEVESMADFGPFQWDEQYPHPGIAVLADTEKLAHGWVKPSGIPCANLLTEEMVLMDYNSRGLDTVFDALVEMYPVP